MKKILTIVVALVVFGCSEPEISSRRYPYVVMKDITTLNEGVEFVAEFKGLGDTPITRYGFLWWQGVTMDSADFFVKEIESAPAIGNFSFVLTSDLEGGIEYNVRPFAQNQSTLVLGDIMSFEAKRTNPPEIQDFSPKSGKSGDVITISGSNFSPSKTRVQVMIGTDKGILISTNSNEIKFKLPENLSRSGEVPLIVKSGGVTLQASEPFLIQGHRITDFNPKSGIIGETEIVITGTGFLETGNTIHFGDYEAVVLEESETEITVRLPYEMNVGAVQVDVEINDQIAIADGMLTIKSRWTKLANFPGTARLDAVSFLVGDFLYLIGGETFEYSDEVWRYDIINDSWTQLADFPGGGRAGGVGFAIGNMIYYGLGGGSGGIDDFWSYNTTTGQWTETFSLASVERPFCTAINGVGYLFDDAVYSFTGQSGWSYKGSPSVYTSTYYDNYFEIDGQTYVLNMWTNGNTGARTYKMYKVDQGNPLSWQYMFDAPFTEKWYHGVSFVSGTFAYVGEGAIFFDERKFMKLDLTTNEWTQIENLQGPLMIRGAVSFSHNNKGYTGLGLVRSHFNPETSYKSNDFWVYDPSIE